MKIMRINANCKNLFIMEIDDEDMRRTYDYEGYVPSDIGLGNDSDAVDLEIDIETGQILNWVPLTFEEVQQRAEEDE